MSNLLLCTNQYVEVLQNENFKIFVFAFHHLEQKKTISDSFKGSQKIHG